MSSRRSMIGILLLIITATCAERVPPPIRVLAFPTEHFFDRTDQGDGTGYEHTLLSEFASHQGRELEIEWFDRVDRLHETLRHADAHTIAAAMITVTPARQSVIDFSLGYFPTRELIITPPGESIDGVADVAGKRVATLKGSSYEALLADIPNVERVYAQTSHEMFELVRTGKADALACDSAVAALMLPFYPLFSVTFATTETSEFAFGLPKGSPLRQPLDAFLSELFASQRHREMMSEEFGDIADLLTAGR